MEKIITLITVIFLALGTLNAQQDCGAVDCPGRCGRFIDNDGDGFCDHGGVTAKKTVVAEPAKEQKDEPTPAKEKEPVKVDKKQVAETNEVAAELEANVPTTTVATETEASGTVETEEVSETPEPQSPYPVYPILGGLLALYIISIVLVKMNVWQKATHRKIWNIALTVTFLVSCLLGTLLAIFIHHGYYPANYVDFLHIHVWFGIGMTIIALFHALWHLNYYKALFHSKKD